MARLLLLISLFAGCLAVIDAIWSAIWNTTGWFVVCLTALVASQVAERMNKQ